MIPIKLKPGVNLFGIRPEILFAANVAQAIWEANGATELVITSCVDGTHSRGSRHYSGLGLDIRTSNLPGGYQGQAAHTCHQELVSALTNQFDVILESDHMHIEYDPER